MVAGLPKIRGARCSGYRCTVPRLSSHLSSRSDTASKACGTPGGCREKSIRALFGTGESTRREMHPPSVCHSLLRRSISGGGRTSRPPTCAPRDSNDRHPT